LIEPGVALVVEVGAKKESPRFCSPLLVTETKQYTSVKLVHKILMGARLVAGVADGDLCGSIAG
jgi:hypothetical protein